MKEHEGLPVHGYRPQSELMVAIVNTHKICEEQLLRHLDQLRDDSDAFDPRWLNIARTHFEHAFMALNRSVFQPQRLQGDLPDMEKVWAEMKQKLGL